MLQLARPEEHDELAVVDARESTLLHPNLCAREGVDGHREVGIVAHEKDVAQARGQRLRVERPAGELGLELRLDAERLASDAGGLRGPQLRARQAGVDL